MHYAMLSYLFIGANQKQYATFNTFTTAAGGMQCC